MCEIGLLLGARKEREQKVGTIVETLAQWKLWVSPRHNNYVQKKKQLCVEINILCFKLSPALGDFAAL